MFMNTPMYMRGSKYMFTFILVPRRREWQEVLTREVNAGVKIVRLAWDRGLGKNDKYEIDLARIVQKNLKSKHERAIRPVFHLTK